MKEKGGGLIRRIGDLGLDARPPECNEHESPGPLWFHRDNLQVIVWNAIDHQIPRVNARLIR